MYKAADQILSLPRDLDKAHDGVLCTQLFVLLNLRSVWLDHFIFHSQLKTLFKRKKKRILFITKGRNINISSHHPSKVEFHSKLSLLLRFTG